MYERFFSLRERPFALSPDPEYLYRSRVHTEALSYLRYGIEGHAGFIVITGEIGSGKTTLLQTALRGVDKHTAVARVVNTQLDARDLIEAVMLDFGLSPDPGLSKPRLLRVLAEYLVEQRINGRLALLVIDEAQNLSLAALEEIRMLSNLETEKSKLIQIVLIGQPELRAMMSRPQLEQLRQRVTVSYHLPALDVDETAAYINHRLARAATGTPIVFPREVTDLAHECSRGVPRRINVIADAILLYGYGEGQREITLDLAEKAIDELKTSGILTEAPAAATTAPMGAADTAHVGAAAPVGVAASAGVGASAGSLASASPASSALDTAATPAMASASPSPVPADLVARQERVLASLQRLLAEQNHLLQEHRQHLAALVERAARPAPVAPPAPPKPTVMAAVPLAKPAPVSPWTAPLTAQTTMHATPLPEQSGFWSRLGRGFFNTFSPAYKD